jgi:hypothetical protein
MTIQQARVFVGRQIGLSTNFDGSRDAFRNLSAAEQTELTKQLIKYIAQNPGDFTDAQVSTANVELGRADRLSIEDTSFDYDLFFNELETNAIQTIGQPLANIGNGVSNTVAALGKLLPFIAFGALAVLALPYILKATKPAA